MLQRIPQPPVHLKDMGGHIRAGRIQSFPEIGKGDLGDIFPVVILVKRGPPPAARLHPLNPFHPPPDRLLPPGILILRQPRQRQRDDHLRRIVNVGILVVMKLKGPPAGRRVFRPHLPIALRQNLVVHQPAAGTLHHRIIRRHPRLQQRHLRQTGIPHRRNARLHRTSILPLNHIGIEPVEPLVQRIGKLVQPGVMQRNQRIYPRRLNAPPSPVRFLMIQDPLNRPPPRQTPQRLHRRFAIQVHQPIQCKQPPRQPVVRRRKRKVGRLPPVGIQFVNLGRLRHRAVRPLGEDDAHRHNGRPGPTGKLIDVERRPRWQQDQLRRQVGRAAPFPLPEKRQPNLGEHPRLGHPAAAQDELPRPRQFRRIRPIPRQLQRKIALDAGADIAGRFVILPPRPVIPLLAQDIVGDLAPPFRPLPIQEMAQHQILGFDRGVGLQFPPPVAAGMLRIPEILMRIADRPFDFPVKRIRTGNAVAAPPRPGRRRATSYGRRLKPVNPRTVHPAPAPSRNRAGLGPRPSTFRFRHQDFAPFFLESR